MALQVELVSPERIAFSGEAKMVIARTTAGDIAFLTGHAPLVGVLQTHSVRVIMDDDSEESIAVHSGFIEVTGNKEASKVTILSDVCELAGAIDVDRARSSKDRAEQALSSDPDDEEAAAALERALVRLEVAGATESV